MVWIDVKKKRLANLTKFASNIIELNKPTTVSGDIISTGNISSSGDLTARTGSFNYIETEQLINHTGDANTGLQMVSDTVTIQGNNVDIGLFASNRIEFNRPITASGNISSKVVKNKF